MTVIIEGADRAGKSTIVAALIEALIPRIPELTYAHCGKDSLPWSDMKAVEAFVREQDVIDRCFDSEVVYGRAIRGYQTPKELIEAWREATKNDLIVYVRVNDDVIRERYAATADEDHYIGAAQSVGVQDEYNHHFAAFPPDNYLVLDGTDDPKANADRILLTLDQMSFA